MRYQSLSSFNRSFKKQSPRDQERIKETIKKLILFFETGQKTTGLGVKKLISNVWEARVGLELRILFAVQKDLVQWGLAGTHDEIRRFLKRLR